MLLATTSGTSSQQDQQQPTHLIVVKLTIPPTTQAILYPVTKNIIHICPHHLLPPRPCTFNCALRPQNHKLTTAHPNLCSPTSPWHDNSSRLQVASIGPSAASASANQAILHHATTSILNFCPRHILPTCPSTFSLTSHQQVHLQQQPNQLVVPLTTTSTTQFISYPGSHKTLTNLAHNISYNHPLIPSITYYPSLDSQLPQSIQIAVTRPDFTTAPSTLCSCRKQPHHSTQTISNHHSPSHRRHCVQHPPNRGHRSPS